MANYSTNCAPFLAPKFPVGPTGSNFKCWKMSYRGATRTFFSHRALNANSYSRVRDSLMEAVGRYRMEVGDCPVWGWRWCHPHVRSHSSNLQKKNNPHRGGQRLSRMLLENAVRIKFLNRWTLTLLLAYPLALSIAHRCHVEPTQPPDRREEEMRKFKFHTKPKRASTFRVYQHRRRTKWPHSRSMLRTLTQNVSNFRNASTALDQ